MVPKIIHRLAPAKEKWHSLWKMCEESWKKHFPEDEYEYRYYDDDDADKYIADNFPQYLNFYNQLPFHIIKLDFIRFCLLFKEGGIYADLDYFVYKNFYDYLNNGFVAGDGRECWVLESYFNLQEFKDETVQNSLMISSPWQSFWHRCIEDCFELYWTYKGEYDPTNVDNPKSNKMVKDIAGPGFLSKCVEEYPRLVRRLNREFFNPHYVSYNTHLFGKHLMTGQWGEEMHKYAEEKYKLALEETPGLSFDDFMERDYLGHRDYKYEDLFKDVPYYDKFILPKKQN